MTDQKQATPAPAKPAPTVGPLLSALIGKLPRHDAMICVCELQSTTFIVVEADSHALLVIGKVIQ